MRLILVVMSGMMFGCASSQPWDYAALGRGFEGAGAIMAANGQAIASRPPPVYAPLPPVAPLIIPATPAWVPIP